MQSGVAVNGNGTITGTLKYVTGYEEFSSNPDDQEGNYLALKFSAGEDETISVSIGDRGPVDLTEDKYLVARLTAADLSNKLVIEAVKGTVTDRREYDISALVLESAS